MAQNFLYMFEFVVDDLLITRPNKCAPEEYPTCVEISFRSSVYVSICDREYGHCVDMCAPKCGKCCLFSLESPVTEKDRLMIHVYKKKTDNCKFLLGATDMPIKPLFDKVTDDFDIENPQWMEKVTRHNACMPDPKTALKRGEAPPPLPDFCYDELEGRKEQFCPTSELSKGLLPLFSMKGEQTGNLMLITRLVCNGPAIVSSFPFSKFCKAGCGCGKPKPCPACSPCKEPCPPPCPKPCMPCKPDCGPCRMPNPCQKPDDKPPACLRYFACNDDRGCPCDECEDYRDRECGIGCKPACKPKRRSKTPCPPSPPCCSSPRQCGGENSPINKKQPDDCDITQDQGFCCTNCCMEECEAEEPCDEDEEISSESVCVPPCFIEPSRPVYGPEAYEEFVACLNGSGVTVRVLKDTHNLVSASCQRNANNARQCDALPCENDDDKYETLEDLFKDRDFIRDSIPKRVAGGSAPKPLNVPNVRANIQYAGINTGCVESYRVPFTQIKNVCTLDKVKEYRKPGCGGEEACDIIVPSTELNHTRSCCLQVDPEEIKKLLRGINVDAKKKGIEICYKSCDDPDSDIFLVKLGSKKACERKRRSVEVELKTPKMPIICPVVKYTTETQIKEAELDAAMSVCQTGKKKGKKGKKGKK